MIKMRNAIVALMIVCNLLLHVQYAEAETDVTKAKRSINTIKSEVRKLKKLRNRSGVRAELAKVAASTRDFHDSDSDGLPDIIENVEGTDSCVDDSDDDGISDGDEEDAGSKPDDSSSSEVEVKSTITSLSETTVTVSGYTFTVTTTTRFKPGSNLSSFKVGDFVEASGKTIAGVLTLRKLSLED